VPGTKFPLSARIVAAQRSLARIVDSSWAFWVSLFSKVRTPIKKLVDRIIQKYHTEEKGTGAPKEMPIIPNGVPAPPSNDKAKKTVYVHTPWWKTLLEVLAVGAGCWYGWVAWHQWQAQLKAMKVDQRAWVSIYVGEKTGNFSITMNNTGKTPALKVTYTASFQGGKRGIIPDVDVSTNSSSPITPNTPPEVVERLKREGYVKDRPLTGYVIAPNSGQEASSYKVRFLQVMAMPGAERGYVQGQITYVDIFGENHKTNFCYWTELPLQPLPPGVFPPSDFIMCKDHNAMD
jgi:hypothetical protein